MNYFKSPSSEPGHRFNHDLLANKADQEAVRKAYPELVHILEFPELVELFLTRERSASRAKRRSRQAGYAAITMGALALVMAAFEPVFAQLGLEYLAPMAAALGALSVVTGSRVLHGGAKRAWLRDRLLAERLRQLHFQAFARKLPSLVKSLGGEAEREAFLEERRHWLKAFQFRFEGNEDAELGMALNDEEGQELWLIHPVDPPLRDLDLTLEQCEPVLLAYRTLRLDHQIQFSSVKLDGAPGSTSEVRRAEGFSRLLYVAIIATFAIHATIVALFLVKQAYGLDLTRYARYSPIAVSVVAALVLASRALEEGLQPGREVERYLQYRTTLRAIRARFDRAPTLDEKLSTIRSMEQASYSEMCTFLKIHNDAKFRM
jgi:hypothetical protein